MCIIRLEGDFINSSMLASMCNYEHNEVVFAKKSICLNIL